METEMGDAEDTSGKPSMGSTVPFTTAFPARKKGDSSTQLANAGNMQGIAVLQGTGMMGGGQQILAGGAAGGSGPQEWEWLTMSL